MAAPSLLQSTLAPAQAVAAARARDGRRWPRVEELLPLGYYLLVATVLAVARFPPGRLAILALVVGAPWGGFYLAARACRASGPDPKRCLNADPERGAWRAVIWQSHLLASSGVATALTGGVRSPLLVTVVTAYFGAVAISGDRRPTRWLLVATAGAVAAIAALPPAWTGPALPPAAFAMLSILSVLGMLALLAPVHDFIHVWRVSFARTCEEMASDALTQTHSLEQIGTKVAHELKNPLTGVKALVQLGLRNAAEAPSHERLQLVEREVARMQEILNNYLSFTRPLQGMTPKGVRLGSLVSDTLVVLSARADAARVHLYAQGDATLEADPRRLREALLNLVANAIEATPPGGEVAVEVTQAGDGAEVVVRDTGRGMTPDTLLRIGTPFFTTRDDGTGLGVVLARTAIAQHGGTLRYESEPGKGTRVRVTLPRVATGAPDAARPAGR